MKKYKELAQALLAFIAIFALFSILETVEGVTIAMAIAAYTRSCAKNVAGNSAIYLAEKDNITSFTITAGEISTVTMGSGLTFQQVDADIDTIIRTQEGEGVGNNIKYTHRVEMKFSQPSTELNTLRNALADASPCGIIAIVTDGNGTSWCVGYNETDGFNRPLRLAVDSDSSGATPSDEEGQVVTIALEVDSGYLDLPFDTTNNGTIKGGSATFITYN